MIERWLVAVRNHPHRPPALQRLALYSLALRLDWVTGRGFASTRDISADASAHKNTVLRATGWARGEGLLIRTRRGHYISGQTAVASEWQLTQSPTGETLGQESQSLNGSNPRSQSAPPKVSAGAHYQESSTSQPSTSARASAAQGQGQHQGPNSTGVGNLISGKEGLGLSSAANSHKPRVHHGPDSATSGAQQIPIEVTHQGPATRRNAREATPMGRWKWINHEGTYLYDIGVNDDGSLHNPNGYPDETVRAAIEGAEVRRRERRSKAATKAAETRRKRTEKRIYEVARRIVDGHTFGPSGRCVICKRALGDPESIERGVGSECWQFVLECIKPVAP